MATLWCRLSYGSSSSNVFPSPDLLLLSLGFSPKLYDYFTADDRSLFLSCKRSLSLQDQRALDEEASGNPLLADVLLFRRTFGPDRQRQYDTVLTHLTTR